MCPDHAIGLRVDSARFGAQGSSGLFYGSTYRTEQFFLFLPIRSAHSCSDCKLGDRSALLTETTSPDRSVHTKVSFNGCVYLLIWSTGGHLYQWPPVTRSR